MVTRTAWDIVVDNTILDASDEFGVYQIVRTGTNGINVYVFYIDSTSDLVYQKSTDSGETWGGAQIIEGTDAYCSVSVWYDRWTIGDTTGDLIYIAACDTGNDELTLFVLDTSDDSAGTNDNTVIDTSNTSIGAGSAGHVSICKGKGGSIYAGASFTTTAGFQIFESEDSGATWSAITAGTNPHTKLNGANDTGCLLPLNTDNDIILFGVNVATDEMNYWIWDDVAESWSAPVEFTRGGVWNHTRTFASWCQDKSNGDVYVLTMSDDNPTAIIICQKFDEGTRVQDKSGTGIPLRIQHAVGSGELNPWLPSSCAISRDQTTGQLVALVNMGESNDSHHIYCSTSSDDGKHWSNWFIVGGDEQGDDMKRMYMPPIFDTGDGIQYMDMNDDANDIICRRFPMTTGGSITGVVKDNSGSPVSGAIVRAYLHGCYPEAGGSDPYCGEVLSDGSGNYTIYLPPRDSYINKGPRLVWTRAYTGEDVKTQPDYIPDLTTTIFGLQNGTAFGIDVGNNELDYEDPADGVSDSFWSRLPDILVRSGFVMDFDLKVNTLTQSVATDSRVMYYVTTNGAVSGSGFCMGLEMLVDSTKKQFKIWQNESGAPVDTSREAEATFTTVISVTTFYVRMGMSDHNKFKIGLFSDASRETLIEAQEITIVSANAVTSQNYIDHYGIGNDNNTHTNVNNGTIKNIRFYQGFYDDINSPTGGTADTVDCSHDVEEV